jgi:hypothetical protein
MSDQVTSTKINTYLTLQVLPLLNTRSNYLLRLWHYDSNTQQTAVVATSPVLTFKNPNEPTNAHLALTQNPSEMRVCK